MVAKLDYNMEDITEQQLNGLVQTMSDCFKSMKTLQASDDSLMKQLTHVDQDTLKQLINNCEGRQPYLDNYMKMQARAIFPELGKLEACVDNVKTLVLNFFNAFTAKYAVNFNMDKGDEAVVSHKAFKEHCLLIMNDAVNARARHMAQQMFDDMVAQQGDARMAA